jgi:cytochrome c nitrite reductase small subunit
MRPILWRLLTLGFIAPSWRLPIFAILGVFAGLGIFTAHISRAPSYLSDDPTTCVNCHIMGPQYLTWQHSSHRSVSCNDCHVPHDTIVNKYLFKAQDGMRHATMFTLRLEPEVIRLSSGAIPVVEANCRRCHEHVVGEIHARKWETGDPRCWDCHRETPHGRSRSLSITPTELRPQLPGVLDNPHHLMQGGRLPNAPSHD